jgi:SAM-dependent methyltransferase
MYWEINRANWDQRAAVHASSQNYDLAGLIADPRRLSRVVRYDAPRLGDLTGLDVLHLQCHIGSDTVSLARLGARSITGLDVSANSLTVARSLASGCGITDATFVESEVYDAVEALDGATFDLVYTGVGALNWLPDIARWAGVVAQLLRPGGRLHLRDGHPMMYALEFTRADEQLVVNLPYFETVEPYVDDTPGTYTDGDASGITATLTHEWNHGLGETVQAVIDAGLTVTDLVEHREMPWKFVEWMVDTGDDTYVLPDGRDRLPLMFTLRAEKPRTT